MTMASGDATLSTQAGAGSKSARRRRNGGRRGSRNDFDTLQWAQTAASADVAHRGDGE